MRNAVSARDWLKQPGKGNGRLRGVHFLFVNRMLRNASVIGGTVFGCGSSMSYDLIVEMLAAAFPLVGLALCVVFWLLSRDDSKPDPIYDRTLTPRT